MDVLELPDRTLTLARAPASRNRTLRAWDSADEHLLRRLDETGALEASPRVLLANDAFGALAAGLHEHGPTSWTDGHFSRTATVENLERNGLPTDAVRFVPGDAVPAGPFDLVLLKLPKSLAWLEDQLLKLRGVLNEGARVIAGGMIRHSPMRAYALLEEIVGPTTTGRGWRKSRLAFASFEPGRELPAALPPVAYRLEEPPLTLSNDANLFSRERLDAGTRLLLNHVPTGDRPLSIADLGCGNGVLGIAAALRRPRADVLFVDASDQAVASARRNAAAAGVAPDRCMFTVGDGLSDEPSASLDLVLCNPPFHQDRGVDDGVAERLIAQARRTLRPGGELRLVGNRHLGHHAKLKKAFGGCETLEEHPKFMVLRAVRSS